MDIKPWAYHIPWYYLSNELSCFSIDQGMRKLHFSQGNYINGINGTNPNALETLEKWVL